MSAAQQRKLQRLVHLGAGIAVAAYLYLPVGASGEVIRLVVVPVLVVTGILMWQAPRIRRLVADMKGRWTGPA